MQIRNHPRTIREAGSPKKRSSGESSGPLAVLASVLALILPAAAVERFEMEFGKAAAVDGNWKTVSFTKTFSDPVVVCTPQIVNNRLPVVTRVREVSAASFEVMLQNPSGAAVAADDVHWIAVEKGIWTMPDGRNIEAQSLETTGVNHKGAWKHAAGSPNQHVFFDRKLPKLSYAREVTLGQVMTHNDAKWSSFLNRRIPHNGEWGYHVGEDADTRRAVETIGVIVAEAGRGVYDGHPYVFGRAESVEGMGKGAGKRHGMGAELPAPEVAVLSERLGKKDLPDGGWPVLTGADALDPSSLKIALDEDQIGDPEREVAAGTVSYMAFGARGGSIAEESLPRLIPRPVEIAVSGGAPFRLGADQAISFEAGHAGAGKVAALFAGFIGPPFGIAFKPSASDEAEAATGAIHFTTAGADASLGKEGYELEVSSAAVTVRAPAHGGLFNGAMTLLQLFPGQIYSRDAVTGVEWVVPAVRIRDYPAWGYRGFMLDMARNFFSLDELKQVIDEMAFLKMNVFHIHWCDNESWSLEIRSRPALTEGRDHITQVQVRELIAYAAERNMQIIPEIEFPGHSGAAIRAYPELANGAGGRAIMPSSQAAWDFYVDVLAEVAALFPSRYLHIGGDEVGYDHVFPAERNKVRESSLSIQLPGKPRRAIDHSAITGKTTSKKLYHWFVSTMITEVVEPLGKTAVAWDEFAMAGRMPETPGRETIAEIWNSSGAVSEGSPAAGQPAIDAHSGGYYMDHYQCTAHLILPGEPRESNSQNGRTPFLETYGKTLSRHGKKLGGETPLWTHIITKNPAKRLDEAEDMYFPRVLGAAEGLWSRPDDRDFLTAHRSVFDANGAQRIRFEAFGIDFRDQHVPPLVSWNSASISTDWMEVEWPIQGRLREAAGVEVFPRQHFGDHPLEIEWIKLYRNGKLLASDVHTGRTRTATIKNVETGARENMDYKLPGAVRDDGAEYTIRMRCRGAGGVSSRGAIFVRAVR